MSLVFKSMILLIYIQENCQHNGFFTNKIETKKIILDSPGFEPGTSSSEGRYVLIFKSTKKSILVQCVVNEGSRLEVVETRDKDCLFSRRQMWHFPHNFVCIWSVLYSLKKCRTSQSQKRWRSLPKNRAVEFWQNDKFSLPAFFLIPLWAFANCHTGKSFITCHNTNSTTILHIQSQQNCDLNAGHVIALHSNGNASHFKNGSPPSLSTITTANQQTNTANLVLDYDNLQREFCSQKIFYGMKNETSFFKYLNFCAKNHSNIDYRRENSFFFKPVPRFARKCCKMRLFEFFSNFVHLWKLEKSPKSIIPKILEN